ncbi:hypothetical protein [Hyalangium gracile]|uniref:hypothetical protein n=1 Tax=Hyalangium gracile TaxID=394092 RepID=UPI001CCDCFC1|nr:hypothetical protein [Hyalangium gracile]
MRLCRVVLLLLVPVQAALAQAEVPPPAGTPAPAEVPTPAQAPSSDVTAPPLVGADVKPAPPPPGTQENQPLVLDKGDALIVHMSEGRSYSGRLLSLMPGELSLELRTRQVVNLPLADVEKLDLEKRWLLKGGLIGGGVGGVVGGLLVGSFCLLASTEGSVDVAGCAGTGALVVGALGAGLGLVAGLANIHWATVYERKQGPLSLTLEDPDVLSRWFANVGHRAEFGLLLGPALELGRPRMTVGFGGRAHLFLLLGRHLALGPELALYNDVGDEDSGSRHTDRKLVQLGGLLRGSLQLGRASTSLLVGLGLHENRSSHFGGSVGADVEVSPWERAPPLALEVRYLYQLDDNGSEPQQQFLTFGLGTRFRW